MCEVSFAFDRATTTTTRARVASRRVASTRRVANRESLLGYAWIRRVEMTREGARTRRARTRRARRSVVRNTEDARVADGTRTARRARGDGEESASIGETDRGFGSNDAREGVGAGSGLVDWATEAGDEWLDASRSKCAIEVRAED